MRPEDIAKQFGDETLGRIYDYLLSIPHHDLASWILSLYAPADVKKLIDSLNEEE